MLVYVEERENERERGWEKTTTSIHQPSILRESLRARELSVRHFCPSEQMDHKTAQDVTEGRE